MSSSKTPPSSDSSHARPTDDRRSYDQREEKSTGATSAPAYEAELQAVAPLLRGRRLTAALAFVAGTGFTLFGCVLSINLHSTSLILM